VKSNSGTNIEYKSELREIGAARRQASLLNAELQAKIHQIDSYFEVPSGLLKQRQEPNKEPVWIFYNRSMSELIRPSDWSLVPEEVVFQRYPIKGQEPQVVVTKLREYWRMENVRIHFDRVRGLGLYFELEAQVIPTCAESACREKVQQLVDTFRPILGEPVTASYAHLLLRGTPGHEDG